MSEISKLIAEIKSEGILRAGNKLEQLYSLTEQMETGYAALQQKLDAMAVENAALKEFGEKLNDMHNILNGEGTGIQGRAEVACQQVALEAAMEEFDTIKTPSTDAYMNSVRAEGAQMCIDALVKSDDDDFTDAPNICVSVMHALRYGTHDTADKAG